MQLNHSSPPFLLLPRTGRVLVVVGRAYLTTYLATYRSEIPVQAGGYRHTPRPNIHTHSAHMQLCNYASFEPGCNGRQTDRQVGRQGPTKWRIIGDTTTPTMHIITQTKYVLCTMYYVSTLSACIHVCLSLPCNIMKWNDFR